MDGPPCEPWEQLRAQCKGVAAVQAPGMKRAVSAASLTSFKHFAFKT